MHDTTDDAHRLTFVSNPVFFPQIAMGPVWQSDCDANHIWTRLFGRTCCMVLHLFACVSEGDAEGELLKDVIFYALDSRQESILWDVKPSFVIVYDPDITFVRQLEVRPYLKHFNFAFSPSQPAMH